MNNETFTKCTCPDLLAINSALADALWVCSEHNALYFGESHNTVIQARAALALNSHKG